MEWRLFARASDGTVIAVNVDKLRVIYIDYENRTCLSDGDESPLRVRESFDEVMDIIKRGKAH